MSRTDATLEQLARVPLFAGLTQKEQSRIAELAKPFHFPAGTTMVEEGTVGGRFYLIVSGQADVLVNRTRVTGLGPGGYFGEIAVIDEGPRTASVVARSEVDALGIASFNLRPLLKNEPGVAFKMLVELCRRLRDADRHAYL